MIHPFHRFFHRWVILLFQNQKGRGAVRVILSPVSWRGEGLVKVESVLPNLIRFNPHYLLENLVGQGTR